MTTQSTQSTQSLKRDSIIKKIQLLKSKTTDNGCSEAEALSAANMISKLLIEYDLTMTDVEVKAQEFLTNIIELDGSVKKPIHDLVYAIGIFCDVKPWYKKGNRKFQYSFFGAKKDTEFAEYLFSLLSNSMEFEYRKYQKTDEYKAIGGRSARSNFFKGMTTRLSKRLQDMKKENIQKSNETGLILYNKMALVNSEFGKLNMRLKTERTKSTITDYSAYISGQKAADKINITRGVSGSGNKNLRLN